MTVESMWDGQKPPRANLNRQAKTVVHMWDAPELLKPDPVKVTNAAHMWDGPELPKL